MVTVDYESIDEILRKLRDRGLAERVKKQTTRIVEDPEVGKPMRYGRKGTREVRIPPFRLTYIYEEGHLIFLGLYHKDEQ